METEQPFESDKPDYIPDEDALVLAIDGFEGPIDLLLTLSRAHKVDITKISILALAEQYLAYIHRARELRLEIAADYLVMAAWLAYLKSRLLLPAPASDDQEGDPAEMAARLAFQLQRLEAMQKAAGAVFDRSRLNRDFFGRGMPESVEVDHISTFSVSLFDLLKAYGSIRRRAEGSTLRIMATQLFSMDQAVARLRTLMGGVPDWSILEQFLPPGLGADPLVWRSAVASTFAATLELCREGVVDISQNGSFAPIYLRKSNRSDEEDGPGLTIVSDDEDAVDGDGDDDFDFDDEEEWPDLRKDE